ncbi:hypothetical protein K8R62_03330 [bacterium]|nr:hypothetical protein [bacterium]
MFLKYIFLGFFVKVVSGFDDTLTAIPLIATITKTKKGRIAFSTGWFLSFFVIIILVLIFSEFLSMFAYTKYVVSGLVFLLAGVVYFDLFSFEKNKKLKEQGKKIRPHHLSKTKFLKLASFGFMVAFVTSIDDAVVFIPLFIQGFWIKLYSFIGIFIASLFNIVFIVYFSKKAGKIKHAKGFSVLGLLFLSFLILIGVV